MKPLLARIDEELATCADPYRRAELLGERGCYLVRVGEFEGARRALTLMRESPVSVTNGRVAVGVMLLEGLLHFFENLDIRCRDRIMRAYAIAHAAGESDLARLSAAWMAHIDFNLDRYADVAKMLRYSLRPPVVESDADCIRARLVLANLLMLAGRPSEASTLYDLARRGAVAIGDDSTIAATFYNRINMLLNLVRVEGVLGIDAEASQRFLEIEIRSVILYHKASGQTSLNQVLELLDAMVLFRSGDFGRAAERYRALLSTGARLNVDADNLVPALELVICLLSMGNVDEANSVLQGLSGYHVGRRSFDDALIVDGLRNRIGLDFGIDVEIASDFLSLEESIRAFRERQDELVAVLDDLCSDIGIEFAREVKGVDDRNGLWSV